DATAATARQLYPVAAVSAPKTLVAATALRAATAASSPAGGRLRLVAALSKTVPLGVAAARFLSNRSIPAGLLAAPRVAAPAVRPPGARSHDRHRKRGCRPGESGQEGTGRLVFQA